MHALVLALFWLGLAVLLTARINLASKTHHPFPSRIEQILTMRTTTDGIAAQSSRHLAAFTKITRRLSRNRARRPNIQRSA